MVPMDQPKAALSMLKRWTSGSLSESAAEPEPIISSMLSCDIISQIDGMLTC